MAHIVKYRDWSGWWDGLRSVAVKTGATSIATSLTTLLGTNGVASMGIPGLQGIGMNWKTAVAQCLIQFGFHTVLAVAQYVQNKPDADIVTVETDTTMITKPAEPPALALQAYGWHLTKTTMITKPAEPPAPTKTP